MRKIIEDMIMSAYRHKDREMATFAYQLMAELANNKDCPPGYLNIGEEMAEKFKGFEWIEENCKLLDFRYGVCQTSIW